MIETKLFKNFHAFVHRADEIQAVIDHGDLLEKLADFDAIDPTGGQWRAIGFLEIEEGAWHVDLQGRGSLCCVQLNERILPGAVQREKMAERVREIQEREGRKLGKKEYAQIRDDIAFELLPKAFIRRKLIPIMILGDYTLIFTSSAKLCDDVLLLLNNAAPGWIGYKPQNLSGAVKNGIAGTLSTIAREGGSPYEDVDGDSVDHFIAANAAVLKGEGKKTIRIKDKPIAEHDIQALLKQAYSVVQLRVDYIEAGDDEESATFTVNDHLVISAMILAIDISTKRQRSSKDDDDTFMNTAWLVAVNAGKIVKTITVVMGGLGPYATQEHTNQADGKKFSIPKIVFGNEEDDDDDEL